MAQAASKGRGFLELIRCGIRSHSSKFTRSAKTFDQGSSHISQSSSKSFSSSSFSGGKSPEKQVGVLNYSSPVNNALGGQSLFVSRVARAICQFRSTPASSQDGMRAVLASRELVSGYRSAYDHGLSRLGLDIRSQRRIFSTHSRAKNEVGSLMKGRGSRAYHVDDRGVQHFRRRGPASWASKLASQNSMGALLVLAGGGLVIYVTNQQTVPYTHRKHFMLVSPRLERRIGEQSFDMMMQEYKTKVLPANHPQSVRVHKISDQIIEALMLGMRASDWGQVDNAGQDVIDISKEWDKDPYDRKSEGRLLDSYGSHTHRDDEVLDEAWVDKSRQEGLKKGQEGYTKHLEGMKWNVVVVDDELVNAVCIPGGKIIVFTGLLKKFRSDAEVATVVAHEIGHAVARHSAESLTHNLFIIVLQLAVLSVFYVPGLVNSISELLLRLPFSRRMEIEADHIGLILMAAAGYDPRLAPGFYEKLGQLDNVPEYAQYMSTHPSGKKRGEMLRNTATMEEAMEIYRQKVAGHGTEGFF